MRISRLFVFAAAPVAAALLTAALSGGTAGASAAPAALALPKSCIQYSNDADTYYNSYVDWEQQAEDDQISGSLADFEADIDLAKGYYGKYQAAMTAASRAGCF
jgi:hypothetical protein